MKQTNINHSDTRDSNCKNIISSRKCYWNPPPTSLYSCTNRSETIVEAQHETKISDRTPCTKPIKCNHTYWINISWVKVGATAWLTTSEPLSEQVSDGSHPMIFKRILRQLCKLLHSSHEFVMFVSKLLFNLISTLFV